MRCKEGKQVYMVSWNIELLALQPRMLNMDDLILRYKFSKIKWDEMRRHIVI